MVERALDALRAASFKEFDLLGVLPVEDWVPTVSRTPRSTSAVQACFTFPQQTFVHIALATRSRPSNSRGSKCNKLNAQNKFCTAEASAELAASFSIHCETALRMCLADE